MEQNRTIRQKNKQPLVQAGQYLENVFLDQKLNNWVGYIFVAGIAGVFGYLMAKQALVGYSLFGLVVGFFVILACAANSELGLYINVFYSFFAFHFSRWLFNDEFPVGIVTDVLILATFLSLFFRNANLKKNFNGFIKNPIVIGMLFLVFYLFIELFNPGGGSFEGWFQTFRRFLGSVFILFISYNVFDSFHRIRRFIIVLFVFTVMTALYACFQQWHGLFEFEKAWVAASEVRFGLIFIGGNYRKFSTMSDPAGFGVLMAACATFFIVLTIGLKKTKQRLIMIAGIIIILLAMAYSGTRTANAMVVGGLGMFIMLTFDRKNTKIFAIFGVLVFLFLMYVPIYDNPTLIRFRTSFSGSKDESYRVREENRKRIQPYVYAHPIGGGLGTSGAGGLKYSPSHVLAGFPPDGGYMKKALETGWIGLGMICILYFMVIKFGIHNYFNARNRVFKPIFAACIASIFSFYIAEFGQEAIGQITDLVVYYPMIAILLKLNQTKDHKLRITDNAD